jgi:hypothetical protein
VPNSEMPGKLGSTPDAVKSKWPVAGQSYTAGRNPIVLYGEQLYKFLNDPGHQTTRSGTHFGRPQDLEMCGAR